MTTLTVGIHPSALAAALLTVAEKDARFYLTGVYIEPAANGGIIATSTNGHIMTVIHDPHGHMSGPAQIWVFPKSAQQALGLRKSKASVNHVLLTVDGNDGRATDHGASVSVSIGTIDARYPDWRAVLPTIAAACPGSGHLNSVYVERIGQIAKALTVRGKKVGIDMAQADRRTASLVTFTGCRDGLEAFAVLMPMRGADAPVTAIPEWSRVPQIAQQAAA